MKKFKTLTEEELNALDNVELMIYKKALWDYGYELEGYLISLKDQWKHVKDLLKERKFDVELEMMILQKEREDNLGELDPSEFYLH